MGPCTTLRASVFLTWVVAPCVAPSGCGEEFLRSILEFVAVSGIKFEQLSGQPRVDLQGRCIALGGQYAMMQYDILGYIDRVLLLHQSSKAEAVLRRIRTHYAAPEDARAALLVKGVGLCVPASCTEAGLRTEELRRVVMLYVVCMAGGVCGDANDLEVQPLWNIEINVTLMDDLIGRGRPSTKLKTDVIIGRAPGNKADKPSILDQAVEREGDNSSQGRKVHDTTSVVGQSPQGERHNHTKLSEDPSVSKGCGHDVLNHLSDIISVSGLPFDLPSGMALFQSDVPYLDHLTRCRALPGRLGRVQLDILAFLSRGLSKPDSGGAHAELRRIRHFYMTEVNPSDLATLQDGIAVCFPLSCIPSGKGGGDGHGEELVNAAMLYFMCIAGGSCWGGHSPGLPRWGAEVNVTFHEDGWTALGGPQPSNATGALQVWGPGAPPALGGISRLAAPGLGSSSACCGSTQDVGDGDFWGPLAGTGFRVPWWMSCYGLSGWERWVSLGRRGALRRRPAGRIVVRAADAMVERYVRFMDEWTSELATHSHVGSDCRPHYMVFDEPALHHDKFNILHYAFAPQSDRRWRTIPEWSDVWSTFCPMGYAAALVARWRGASEAGLLSSASKDLSTARNMLGHCGEFDLLDKRIWGFSSVELDDEILRAQLRKEPKDLRGRRPARVRMGRTARAMEVREIQWHALQLNSLVRIRLHAAAQGSSTAPPRLALLTMPAYLSVLLVPILERLWDGVLSLAILYIGVWEAHEKCRECMDRYRNHYVVDDPALRAIPYNSSIKFTSGAGGIVWDDDFQIADFDYQLALALGTNSRATVAEVLLCTAATWVCFTASQLSQKPILTLDLYSPLHGSPKYGDPDAENELMRTIFKLNAQQFENSKNYGPFASVWVRDNPLRGYPIEPWGTFFPFVAMLSLHISERYACRGDVLIMREGSLGRFSVTFRGRIFFATLAQFVTDASPWRFRQLPYSKLRLSYRQIAEHRAAVFVPMIPSTKVTFKDLVTMEMPLFLPSAQLQESVSAPWACAAQYAAGAPEWVLTLCRIEVLGPQLGLSEFMRHPYVQHFESLTDLVAQLASMDCADLSALSNKMSRWNEALIKDDEVFWRSAFGALRAERRQMDSDVGFNLPRPEFRVASVEEPRCDDVPAADFCAYSLQSEATRRVCCEQVLVVRERRAVRIAAGPAPPEVPARERCLWEPSACNDTVLRHATHLLQEFPELT